MRTTCRLFFFFFSSRRRHTRCSRDWSSDVCSSDLWPHGTILYDLQLRADSATLRDFPFIDRRLASVAGAGVVSGDVRLRSHGARLLEIGLDPLQLSDGGGTPSGHLTAFSAADPGLGAVRGPDPPA